MLFFFFQLELAACTIQGQSLNCLMVNSSSNTAAVVSNGKFLENNIAVEEIIATVKEQMKRKTLPEQEVAVLL